MNRMDKEVRVVFLDLWRTLTVSNCREPIWVLQRAVGHQLDDNDPTGVISDEDFLTYCLTTNITDPRSFAEAALEQFGGNKIDETNFEKFVRIITQESNCLAQYWDVESTLKSLEEMNIRIGMISNLWPFPQQKILKSGGIEKYIEPELKLLSYEIGLRKPDPRVFKMAIERARVAPENCLMVGDNLYHDCLPAIDAGMGAVLLDREQRYSESEIQNHYIQNLTELISILQD